jgi:hypothetical protein
MKVSYVALLVALPLIFSCKPRTYNSGGSTQSLNSMCRLYSNPVSDFKLGFAEKNGITNYKVFRDIVNKDESVDETRRYVVRVVFHGLTEPQYKLLMGHYGGQGFVAYDPNRCFELTDFLPPKMQAYVDRWLVTSVSPDSRIPSDWQSPYLLSEVVDSGVTMNCWTTAYEMLREWGKPWAQTQGKLAYFGPEDAEKLMTKNSRAIALQQPLARSAWNEAKIAERNAGRLPGDLLHIRTQFSFIGPAHAALWIDDDLYFEKTNSSSDDPIRLAFYADVIRPYLSQDTAEMPMTMEFLRFKPGSLAAQESIAGRDPWGREGLTALPPEVKKSTIFTLDLGMGGGLKEFSANRILTFPIGRDPKTGRATLQGAGEMKNFLLSNELCKSSKYGDWKFSYKVTTDLQLFVFNPEGKEIARISGKRGSTNGGLAEFRTSDKVLTVKQEGGASTMNFSLDHPGVNSAIGLICGRSDAFK